jgi:hypothetical protein
LICERCEEGRFADVAEENKGEKKDKILNLTQEVSNSKIYPGFQTDICPSVSLTVSQNPSFPSCYSILIIITIIIIQLIY